MNRTLALLSILAIAATVAVVDWSSPAAGVAYTTAIEKTGEHVRLSVAWPSSNPPQFNFIGASNLTGGESLEYAVLRPDVADAHEVWFDFHNQTQSVQLWRIYFR